ncbi:hypothetical protein BK816_08795 [Boudabousia tangfeifanii]|uniref:Uncharacterized protein n=1 Tax=Boudabousia tangfeifanii TaxID=1912795 RepID=A0A1D9MM46_9ACTO|nr:hypothetical protein [Boudabousia tangfeifanii]AOZ73355.1 hypothetical protein BK816_08795 [Boudabousia tangfeifanii]
MAQELSSGQDRGWTPWPKESLSQRTLRSLTGRLAHLPYYQEKAKELKPLGKILCRLGGAVVESAVANIPDPWQKFASLGEDADQKWNLNIEAMQEFFFDHPWLYQTVMHNVSRTAGLTTWALRGVLDFIDDLPVEVSPSQLRQRRRLEAALPTTGFTTLMALVLSGGTALGYFRGGKVHARLINDNGKALPVTQIPPFIREAGWDDAQAAGIWVDLNNPDHPLGKLNQPHSPLLVRGKLESPLPLKFEMRRLNAPTSLDQTIADLDDLYWSSGAGMVMKIMAIGEGENLRWLAIVPGTDHMAMMSMPNPADTESNVREMLGLRSAARAGVELAIVRAMSHAGVKPQDCKQQKLMLVGHSQGGIVAHALAGDQDALINVTHALTIGSPSRNLPLPKSLVNISIEHTQDMIPWMDGMLADNLDDRIFVRRKLTKPKRNPLYYAHSAGTYLETVKILLAEVEAEIAAAQANQVPIGRTAKAVKELNRMLPKPGEKVEVYFYEIAQEILLPQKPDTCPIDPHSPSKYPEDDYRFEAFSQVLDRAEFDPLPDWEEGLKPVDPNAQIRKIVSLTDTLITANQTSDPEPKNKGN